MPRLVLGGLDSIRSTLRHITTSARVFARHSLLFNRFYPAALTVNSPALLTYICPLINVTLLKTPAIIFQDL